MKYIYGPVKSRRLGLSLGISLTAYKTCNFDCIYCQLGKTRELTAERSECVKIADILDELKAWLDDNAQELVTLDYITLSGMGEPTLNSKIGELIIEIKKIAALPVAVITNASFLHDKSLRKALINADLIVPSLDTVIPEVFKKLDRPHPSVKLGDIIEGLKCLRKEFRGKIWLEVMLVSGINDGMEQIAKLKKVIDEIKPDKVQINTPVRSTAEPNIFPPDASKLEAIKEILGANCEIF